MTKRTIYKLSVNTLEDMYFMELHDLHVHVSKLNMELHIFMDRVLRPVDNLIGHKVAKDVGSITPVTLYMSE